MNDFKDFNLKEFSLAFGNIFSRLDKLEKLMQEVNKELEEFTNKE
ncbi:MAG: hypothetical protein ACXAEU_16140 [Candidatus Hodarchaeales archaeon]|jgi:hypothetical protein